MKAKSVVIHEPVFNVDIFVQRGGEVNECLKKYAKKLGREAWELEENKGRMGYFATVLGNKSGCIWLHEKAG